MGGRNSALRRSAILTRSSRMSSIEENKSTYFLLDISISLRTEQSKAKFFYKIIYYIEWQNSFFFVRETLSFFYTCRQIFLAFATKKLIGPLDQGSWIIHISESILSKRIFVIANLEPLCKFHSPLQPETKIKDQERNILKSSININIISYQLFLTHLTFLLKSCPWFFLSIDKNFPCFFLWANFVSPILCQYLKRSGNESLFVLFCWLYGVSV